MEIVDRMESAMSVGAVHLGHAVSRLAALPRSDVVDCLVQNARDRFAGIEANVGCCEHARVAQKRVRRAPAAVAAQAAAAHGSLGRGTAFVLEHIEPGRGYGPAVERAQQSLLVDQRTARGVKQHDTGLDAGEGVVRQQVVRLRGQRQVETQDVAAFEQLGR